MRRQLLIFALGLFACLSTFGQAKLGFTNLNGFPNVIVNGTSYNLSGYIKNVGTDTLYDPVKLVFSANNGPNIPIQNNVSLGTLAPGDSVYWTKGGHNFPGGQFAPGNNDVLIWPTRMNGQQQQVESVIEQMEVFFVDNQSSAFRMTQEPTGFTNSVPLFQPIDLEVTAENVGAKENSNEVELYMSYAGGEWIVLQADGDHYAVGQQVTFTITGFVLAERLISYGAETPTGMEGNIKFFVAEGDALPPVNSYSYPISMGSATSIDPSQDHVGTVYPNPAHDVLRVAYDGAPVINVEVYGFDGRLVRRYDHAVMNIYLEGLASGKYFVRIQTEESSESHVFIKE